MYQKQPSEFDKPVKGGIDQAVRVGFQACIRIIEREIKLSQHIQEDRKRRGEKQLEGSGIWWTAYESGLVTVKDEILNLLNKLDGEREDEQAGGNEATSDDDPAAGSSKHL